MHFKFPGWHVCILYIAYHEYSMIDPSGTMITGTSCCRLATLLDVWICDGAWWLGRTVLRLFLSVVFSVFSALNSTLMVFYHMF